MDVNGGEYRIGLMRYSTDGDVQFNLDDYANDANGFRNAVNDVRYKGGKTNTHKAIDKVRTQMFRQREGDRDYARNFILLLTDNDRSEGTSLFLSNNNYAMCPFHLEKSRVIGQKVDT